MVALACLAVFGLAYLVNTTTISVFYHRGLAHRAVTLSPAARRRVARWGIWLTGLDAKGWVCMHRLHHRYSDTDRDPHSPARFGLFGVLLGQLRSYERTLVGLARGEATYCDEVRDLDFDVSALNRRGLWFAPYLLHLAIALVVGATTGLWALAAAYWLGMMSHPIEGWIVNALGHASGGRNFDTSDDSRNNHLAAWLIMGEGFQNNHHAYPASARFAHRWYELDPGYVVCRLLERAGVLTVQRDTLIPWAHTGEEIAAPPA